METCISILDENWEVLKELFPCSWEELAEETGATQRLRGFESTESLLRTLLLHIAKGYSLRETSVKAKAAGLASVSDVALLKRLRKSKYWLRELCLALMADSNKLFPLKDKNIKIRMFDGTIVKEPGKTGSQWRIHYSLQLPQLLCDHFSLTPSSGSGNGESFRRFSIRKGEYVIGDRGYSTAQGIEYVASKGAYSLVRVNTGSLPLFSSKNRRFKLESSLKELKEPGAVGEWKVLIDGKQGFITGRLCAIRKSEHAIELAHKKIKQEAKRKQTTIKPETLEFAKYIIVFTTFPSKGFSASEVLEWYRLRWQVELMFKRLKSLAELGHLPKHDDESSQAWLYGKLFVGLLTEKLVHIALDISPWGYINSQKSASK